MKLIYACSSNAGKLREFELVAGERGAGSFSLVPLPGLRDIRPPDESGATFEANASAKAVYYSAFTNAMVLADDSGIEVDALGGAPGVYSARYASPPRADRPAQDAANSLLLLENMRDQEDRTARFVCAIAVARAGQVLQLVRGSVEGKLLTTPTGSGGFGYDPLFYYPEFACSFAELDEARKFKVSHRGSALRQIAAWLS